MRCTYNNGNSIPHYMFYAILSFHLHISISTVLNRILYHLQRNYAVYYHIIKITTNLRGYIKASISISISSRIMYVSYKSLF